MKPFRCVTSTDDESSDQFAVFELSLAMALLSSTQPMRHCLLLPSVRCMLSADLLRGCERSMPTYGPTRGTVPASRVMRQRQGNPVPACGQHCKANLLNWPLLLFFTLGRPPACRHVPRKSRIDEVKAQHLLHNTLQHNDARSG